MSARGRFLRCGLAMAAAALVSSASATERDGAGAFRTATVTYTTSSTAYLNVGSRDGLETGALVEVLRDGAVAASIPVKEVTASRSACALSQGADVRPGDRARFRAAAARPTPAPSKPSPSPRRRDVGLHGRVGIRWLWVRDRAELGQDFHQPALDLRLEGSQIGGEPFDLSVDVRARRTYRTDENGDKDIEGRSRVYLLNGSWRGGPVRLTLGRQFASSLSNVNVFDGFRGEYSGRRWSVGLFAGTQPDPANYTFSTDVREAGLYGEVRNQPGRALRWAVTGGVVASTAEGATNRDFLYVQAHLESRVVSFHAAQEVDINRGWRRDAEDSALSGTSTFAFVRVRPTKTFTLDAGYDNRRNVRLWRDRETPETDFDDSFRQGVWAGVEWRPRNRFLLGVSGRNSRGGDAGSSSAYTLNLGVLRISSVHLDLRSRTTRYLTPRLDGWLESLSAAMDLGSMVRLEVHGGIRRETFLLIGSEDRSLSWIGSDLDVMIGRHWYLSLAVERTSGADEDTDQAYATFCYRF